MNWKTGVKAWEEIGVKNQASPIKPVSKKVGAVPNTDILSKIKEFAVIGDVTGINKIIGELKSSDRDFSEFISKISLFAQVYDVESIVTYINTQLEK